MDFRGLGLCLGALFVLAGCPDAEGKFCAFDDRYKNINNDGAGVGTCESVAIQTTCELCSTNPSDAEATGDYLFTLATNIAPSLPFLFDADVTLSGGMLSIVAQPLVAADRSTPVGASFTIGPIALDGGYCIDQDLPTIDVPGMANGVSGSDASATVQLVGSVCSPADFICGVIPKGTALVNGASLDIAGSTFTLERLSAPGVYPEPPTINCEMEKAAPL